MEEENELLERLRGGETAALELLIGRCSPYVFAVLRRRIGPYARAEDLEELASNVFFALWRHRRRIRAGHLRPWLSRVAENEAKSWLRRQRLSTVPAEDCLMLPDAAAERLEDETERRLLAEQALALLDTQTREIFRRYYADRQTVAEIAAALDMKLPTVKSRLQRGRAQLREALQEGEKQ